MGKHLGILTGRKYLILHTINFAIPWFTNWSALTSVLIFFPRKMIWAYNSMSFCPVKSIKYVLRINSNVKLKWTPFEGAIGIFFFIKVLFPRRTVFRKHTFQWGSKLNNKYLNFSMCNINSLIRRLFASSTFCITFGKHKQESFNSLSLNSFDAIYITASSLLFPVFRLSGFMVREKLSYIP